MKGRRIRKGRKEGLEKVGGLGREEGGSWEGRRIRKGGRRMLRR